jgi:PEP-CTERM motif
LGVNGFGGIQKWTYNPANAAVDNGWSESYVISDGTNVGTDGYLGVAGQLVTNANPALDQVVLYATNADGTVLEQFTDPLEATNNTAVDASVITLATAGTDQIFRGVALAPVPEPTSLSLVGLGALGLLRRRRNRA